MNKLSVMRLAAGLPVLFALARTLEFLGRDYGSVLHPVSVHVILPAVFGIPTGLLLVVWMAGFYAWNLPLFAGHASTPRRSIWLWVFFTLLSLADYATGWHYGLRYQGRRTMQVWLVLSLALCVTSWLLLRASRRNPSFPKALAAHTTVWLWITTVAVPWLGEMP